MNINKYIDHTLLAATAQSEEIQKLCFEAKKFGFYAVCVNSSRVKVAKNELVETDVKIAATIGFPLGACFTEAKIAEAVKSVQDGADEIDMVINIGFLKDGKSAEVQREILYIKKAIENCVLKVIIETCYLSEKEIMKACELAMQAGADFIKTSTGFGSRGASYDDIKIMKKVVGEEIKIKASGGIKDAETAMKYINLGVHRIGTSSGIKIIS
ncbi:deoxyribose-phosphate aldolase [Christiangramia forsetii]|uniref:Deoxyribose-phosphate aldolase n=2 Tax=Christiangramia forsetii TaxID=411153 RepID=A0M5Q1_CHRFK|nr:deoxyribose-phosphate aldolase [Christiangramia forsetii]GGG32451.1 2-deoxyribose-5-phosphate aldolase [Christiangramia forsetii]CAL67946.1 deoxyribose-phosphate aldolase-2 [Christiangramia forsetii KT0803]